MECITDGGNGVWYGYPSQVFTATECIITDGGNGVWYGYTRQAGTFIE